MLKVKINVIYNDNLGDLFMLTGPKLILILLENIPTFDLKIIEEVMKFLKSIPSVGLQIDIKTRLIRLEKYFINSNGTIEDIKKLKELFTTYFPDWSDIFFMNLTQSCIARYSYGEFYLKDFERGKESFELIDDVETQNRILEKLRITIWEFRSLGKK